MGEGPTSDELYTESAEVLEDPDDVVDGAARGDSPDGPPQRSRSLWATVARRTPAAAVLVLLLSVAALSQTGEGQELVLNAALDRIRGSLTGELRVGGDTQRNAC